MRKLVLQNEISTVFQEMLLIQLEFHRRKKITPPTCHIQKLIPGAL